MQNNRYKLLIFSFLTLVCASLQAQTTDLRTLLTNLTQAQKKQALEYLRSLNGDDLDKAITLTYNQLDPSAQAKATQYLQALQPRNDGRPARTTVQWNRDTLRFGAIEEGTILIDSFTVTNTGKVPYVITGNQTACDCTVLRAPTQPLLPGEHAAVRIEFNSVGKTGKVRTGIVLQDNSTPNARTILYLVGEVKPRKTGKKKPWE